MSTKYLVLGVTSPSGGQAVITLHACLVGMLEGLYFVFLGKVYGDLVCHVCPLFDVAISGHSWPYSTWDMARIGLWPYYSQTR
jgi:hypothetical protein